MIYVFSGSRSGPSTVFTQLIDAAAFPWGIDLRGFGWSVTSGGGGGGSEGGGGGGDGLDVDEDGYPEVGVGAFGADAVVVLKSKRVVNVEMQINLDRQIINLNDTSCEKGGAGEEGREEGKKVPCVGIEFCFEFDGKSVPDEIRLDVEWRVSASLMMLR